MLSPPPSVLFTWRHWGVLSGKFKGNQGHGEQLEMYGIAKCLVTEDLKIQTIEVFYDPDNFIKACEGRLKPSELRGGRALLGDIECPFIVRSSKEKRNKRDSSAASATEPGPADSPGSAASAASPAAAAAPAATQPAPAPAATTTSTQFCTTQ